MTWKIVVDTRPSNEALTRRSWPPSAVVRVVMRSTAIQGVWATMFRTVASTFAAGTWSEPCSAASLAARISAASTAAWIWARPLMARE